MFGVIISSRPIITESQTVSPSQVAFTIPASPAFNHIVVFLLPGQQLPPDTGAAVYIQLPNSTEFKFLGALANDKPSAIFKINDRAVTGNVVAAGGIDDAMVDDSAPLGAATGAAVTLGISAEPIAQIQQSLANLRSSSSAATASMSTQLVRTGPSAGPSPVSTKVLAQRIIANAYNFLASFSGNVGPNGMEVVPLKSFQDWWKKFEKKVEMDPGFLERGDQS